MGDLESAMQRGLEIPEVSEIITGDFMLLSIVGLDNVAKIVGAAVGIHDFRYDECLYYPKDLISLVGRISKHFTNLRGVQNSLSVALLNTLGFGINHDGAEGLNERDFDNFYMMNHVAKASKSVQMVGRDVKGFMSINVDYSYAIRFSPFFGRYMHMKISIKGTSLITTTLVFTKLLSTLRSLDNQAVDLHEKTEQRRLRHDIENVKEKAQDAKLSINIRYDGFTDNPIPAFQPPPGPPPVPAAGAAAGPAGPAAGAEG